MSKQTFLQELSDYEHRGGRLTFTFGDVVLPVLFDSIKVPEHVTGEQLKALNNFQITVIAEAIQADGFTGAADAWSHF